MTMLSEAYHGTVRFYTGRCRLEDPLYFISGLANKDKCQSEFIW